MCKLQIIHKRDSAIIKDKVIECDELKRISVNNLPYYLTICEDNEIFSLEFYFLGNSDQESFHTSVVNLRYGKETGRLYSLTIHVQLLDFDNRKWIELQNEISSKISLADALKKDFMLFLKIIHNQLNTLKSR